MCVHAQHIASFCHFVRDFNSACALDLQVIFANSTLSHVVVRRQTFQLASFCMVRTNVPHVFPPLTVHSHAPDISSSSHLKFYCFYFVMVMPNATSGLAFCRVPANALQVYHYYICCPSSGIKMDEKNEEKKLNIHCVWHLKISLSYAA